jgi:hypothetical protein
MIFALLPSVVSPASPIGEEPRGERALHLSLQTDRPVYQAGQPVQFRLTLSNHSTNAITLPCKDSQRFDLLVQDASGRSLWRWSEEQMFAQMLGEETIGPGETRVYTADFNGKLSAAQYRASGIIVCIEPPLSAHAVFTVQ